jgi:hypothetical protein
MYSRRSVDIGLKVAEQILGFEPIYHTTLANDINITRHRF